MFAADLTRYLKGYLRIKIEGQSTEHFINGCLHEKISLWRLKKISKNKMTLNLGVKSFKKLRPIARKSKCKVKILEKKGLPFLLRKYRKRKTFLLGVFIFFVALNFLASFLWTIEIKGNERVESKNILSLLETMNIKPGVMKYGIDADKVAGKMVLELSDLAWAGIEIRGTKMLIEVSESTLPPELVPLDIPCDIIAAKDGYIESIVVRQGEKKVKAGDTVKKGQLLVSGLLENKNDKTQTMLVHSMAEVKARTWYEADSKIINIIKKKVPTGNVKNIYKLDLFSKTIGIPFIKNKFENFEVTKTLRSLSFGEKLVLPIGLVTERYSEYNIVNTELDSYTARKLAIDGAYEAILDRIPKGTRILKTVISDILQDEKAAVRVVVECLEEIGLTKEIGGN